MLIPNEINSLGEPRRGCREKGVLPHAVTFATRLLAVISGPGMGHQRTPAGPCTDRGPRAPRPGTVPRDPRPRPAHPARIGAAEPGAPRCGGRARQGCAALGRAALGRAGPGPCAGSRIPGTCALGAPDLRPSGAPRTRPWACGSRASVHPPGFGPRRPREGLSCFRQSPSRHSRPHST
jgi:hypothetical protein